MLNKNTFTFLALFTLAILSIGMVSAVTIVTDGFEYSSLATGNWITQSDGGGNWTLALNPNSGSNNAEASPGMNATRFTANMTKMYSTVNHNNIKLRFSYELINIESPDYLKVFWSIDGSSFQQVTNGEFTSETTGYENSGTLNLPSATANISNLHLRFECSTNSNAETCRVDDLIIEGDEIETPAPTPQIQFCEVGSAEGNLRIVDVDIDNLGDGDDTEWELLDEIEIDVDVENLGNDDEDVDDVIVEMGLFKSGDAKNYARDLDFTSSGDEEQELGDVDGGDEETLTFSFRVPVDFDKEDYTLIFKAYPDGDEDETCVQSDNFQESIDVIGEQDEENSVIAEDFTFPVEAVCGETVSGSFTVFNIGDDDYKDQIAVRIFSNELDVNEELIARGDFDEGDEETFDFAFVVPEGLADGFYRLNFQTFYDYDEDDNTYGESSEETFTHNIRIFGCDESTPETGSALISASLDSEANAGEELTVTATITNLASTQMNFVIDAVGYNSWANLASISDRTLLLAPGQSATTTITLNVNSDVSGAQSFDIEVTSAETNSVQTREVEVFIEGRRPGITGAFIGGSGFIWAIAIINIVLIVLIIIVAIRLSRR